VAARSEARHRRVLQNRLATQLHDQGVAYASQVPPAFRSTFVNGFSNASGGFKVGVGETGAQLPAGVRRAGGRPTALFHDVLPTPT